MAAPASILNAQTGQLDVVVRPDGSVLLKAGTSRRNFTPSGITPDATAQTVEVQASGGGLTDRSGTITLGGTAQDAMASNANRTYLLIQNLHATEALWVNFGANAVQSQPSIVLPTFGASFVMEGVFVSTDRVSVIAASTSHPWAAKEA